MVVSCCHPIEHVTESLEFVAAWIPVPVRFYFNILALELHRILRCYILPVCNLCKCILLASLSPGSKNVDGFLTLTVKEKNPFANYFAGSEYCGIRVHAAPHYGRRTGTDSRFAENLPNKGAENVEQHFFIQMLLNFKINFF